MRAYFIKPQARLDLIDIWNHIAEESIPGANKVAEALETAIIGLADMPGKGHGRSDVRDARIRFRSVYSYIIAFRYDDTTLTVIRVVHGRRNVRKLFPRKS